MVPHAPAHEKSIDLMPPAPAPRSPLNIAQMPAKANSGRSSLSANQTTSFFLVSGFGSGVYSAKLLAETRQRFSGLSEPRQCGDDVLRMLVTHHDQFALVFANGTAIKGPSQRL